MYIKNPKKHLVFRENEMFLDFDLKPITLKPSHIIVSSLNHPAFVHATLDCQSPESELSNALLCLCIQEGIINPHNRYLLTYAKLKSHQYRVFLLEDTNLAHEIIPLIFLPFGIEDKPNGLFMIQDWLCLYENGVLVYDYFCNDAKALQDCLLFIEALYHTQCLKLRYIGGMLSTMDSSEIRHIHTNLECEVLDSSIERMSLDFALRLNEQGVSYKPLYNEMRKSIYHTQSFWNLLKIVACFAICALYPIGKMLYTDSLSSQIQILKSQNETLLATLNEQKSKSQELPKKINEIHSMIETLSNIHSQYIPRIQIISAISEIASKNTSWIKELELKSHLERGETIVDMSVCSQQEEHLAKFIYTLKNSQNIQVLDESFIDMQDIYNAKITLKILNA